MTRLISKFLTVLRMLPIFFLFIPCLSYAESPVCKELKKINNIDELLYQFYINLESDCLFTMPVEQLEEIWGIKILSERRPTPEKSIPQLRTGKYFHKKNFKSEIDAFFVEMYHGSNNSKIFDIQITGEYYKLHMTLFPDGNFPKLLPEPLKKSDDAYFYMRSTSKSLRPKNTGKYNKEYMYYWVNKEKTHMIYLHPNSVNSVTRVTILNDVLSFIQ